MICPTMIKALRRMVEETTGAILAERGDWLLVESALFFDKGIVYVSNPNRHDGIWSFRVLEEEAKEL